MKLLKCTCIMQVTRSHIEAERLLRGLPEASLSSLRLKSGDGEIGDIKDTMEVREEMEVVLDPIPFSSNASSKWVSPVSFSGLFSSW